MSDRILFVDDERILLATMARMLRKSFDLTTAEGGVKGLEVIREHGPFSVVVSDLRMPGMDGIAFLARVRDTAPDTIRVMLTGGGDLNAAVEAINEGQIFRFLTKPCDVGVLETTLRACLEQHRLVRAERELLEETLAGSARVMTEILGIVNPSAFGRASRVRQYMGHMARALGMRDIWQYELAGMLSMIGCVAVPAEVLDKVCAGQHLSDEETKSFASHPDLGRSLLKRIPRLEAVAEIIGNQRRSSRAVDVGDEKELGSAMLRLALAFDLHLARGDAPLDAIAELSRDAGQHPAQLIAALRDFQTARSELVPRLCRVDDLEIGVILDQDVRTPNGMLLAARGHEVAPALIQLLRNFATGVGVVQPFRVLAPAAERSMLAA